MEEFFSLTSRADLKDNIDVLAMIISYVSRKKKFSLRQVNRDFKTLVIPRSMVSIRLTQN